MLFHQERKLLLQLRHWTETERARSARERQRGERHVAALYQKISAVDAVGHVRRGRKESRSKSVQPIRLYLLFSALYFTVAALRQSEISQIRHDARHPERFGAIHGRNTVAVAAVRVGAMFHE